MIRKIAQSGRASGRLSDASTARSARVSRGREVRRRRIASSCRRTRISSSFEGRDRPGSHTSANRFRTTRYTIAVIAPSPLGGPRRAGSLARREALADVADAHRATPAEVALAWLLELSPAMVAIPGARRPETARSAARAAKLELEADDREVLANALGGPRPARLQRPRTRHDTDVVLIMGIPGAGKTRLARTRAVAREAAAGTNSSAGRRRAGTTRSPPARRPWPRGARRRLRARFQSRRDSVEDQVRCAPVALLERVLPARLPQRGGGDEDTYARLPGWRRARQGHLLDPGQALVGRRWLELAERPHLGGRRVNARLTPCQLPQFLASRERAETLE